MQCLLLQKPHSKSKTKEHIAHLERRMNLWSEGNVDALLSEGKCIQKHVPSNVRATMEMEKIARGFNRLMLQGRIRQAVRLISNANKRGCLSLDQLIPVGEDQDGNIQMKTTRDILKEKHPDGKTPDPEILLAESDTDEFHHDPIVFERITGELIQQAAIKTQGAAGPSGIDAYAWRRFCSSFKGASTDLCNALAGVARRLCTSVVHPESISAFVACRLIPLDKNPGVRPIGIGEVPRRIVAKSILKVIGNDIQAAAGPLQACAGHEAGCEAAIHAMKEIQSLQETEVILLVDANNAFNTINRQAALHNIRIICPAISTILNNTYQKPIRLFITGGEEIRSTEGITQGDPLAMAMYALAISPLIQKLKIDEPNAKQVWFADDSTAAGKVKAVRRWWTCLTNIGPKIGYYPNPSKTYLVVKPEFLDEARNMFEGTGIKLTTEGHGLLGSTVGTTKFNKEFVAGKVESFVEEIDTLSKIAEMYPQAAYAAFSHGIVGKWRYIMRTNNDINTLFQPLEDVIKQTFIPALTGRGQCSEEERNLLTLPLRYGGLNIVNSTTMANAEFNSSQKISEPLKEMIIDQRESFTKPQLQSIKNDLRKQKIEEIENSATQIRENLSQTKQRMMDLACEKGASSWLSALPLQDQGFDLNKGEFRDAISIRYGWQLKNVPMHCKCGGSFSVDHAMICPVGGLPIVRHNEIRDITADWLNEICPDVEKEPQLQPLNGETILPRTANREDEARADIRAKGFWSKQQVAFFDVRVFHPNAPSYRNTSIPALYRQHELGKKREYGDRIREIEHASFTPLIFSTTGGLAKETTVAYKRIAEMLALKRKSHYSITLTWMRCMLSFALIRCAVTAIRGSRSTPHRMQAANIELGYMEGRLVKL